MKNILKTLPAAIMICIALSALYSCGDEDTTTLYDLRISDNYHVFPAEGGSLTVTVTTDYSEGWKPEFTGADWFSAENEGSDAITFEVAANENDAPRSVTIKFVAGEITKELVITQNGKNEERSIFYRSFISALLATSPDGRYLVTYTANGSDYNDIYLWDTETDENEIVCTLPQEGIYTNIIAISNTGVIIVQTNESNNDQLLINGELTNVSIPAGYRSVKLTDISADGNVYVGHAVNITTKKSSAFKWENGTPTLLPAPEIGRINKIAPTSIFAEAVSPDGNIVVGRAWINNKNEGIYWKDGEWKWMGEVIRKEVEISGMMQPYDFICANYSYMKGLFSPDSRYFAGCFEGWGESILGMGIRVNVPALFDFSTEEFVSIIDEEVLSISKRGGRGTCATNDGKLFYMITGSPVEASYLWDNGTIGLSAPYVTGRYNNIHLTNDVGVTCINEERNLLIGTLSVMNGVAQVPFYIKPLE